MEAPGGGGYALVSALPSRGPHGGEKSIWLHHPCLLGVRVVGRNQYGYITLAFLGSPGGVVARCAHGSMLLEYSPSFYPVERPPQNHTQGPNFCTLQPLLAYQEFLFFVLMLVTGPRVLISAPCSSC